MSKKILIWFFISISCGSLGLYFLRLLTDEPSKTKPEHLDDMFARMFENFVQRTKYNYKEILKSGTQYNDQDKIFAQLAEKLMHLKQNTYEYQQVQKELSAEIARNQDSFKSFYEKTSKMTPEEMSNLVKNFKDHEENYDKELDNIGKMKPLTDGQEGRQ